MSDNLDKQWRRLEMQVVATCFFFMGVFVGFGIFALQFAI